MNLQKVFQTLNEQHFKAVLPHPILKWNSRLRATAGRFTPGTRVPFLPETAVIEIASYLQGIENGAKHVQDTMLHEMIHYWLWFRHRPYGHTKEFYAKMRATGAKRYNPVPIEQKVKYRYHCPSCKSDYPARRRLGIVACSKCCKQYNKGRYHPRFQLEMHLPEEEGTKPITLREPEFSGKETSLASQSAAAENTEQESFLSTRKILEKLEGLKSIVDRTQILIKNKPEESMRESKS